MPRHHKFLSLLAVIVASAVAAAILARGGLSSLRGLTGRVEAPRVHATERFRRVGTGTRPGSRGWTLHTALVIALADSIAGLAFCAGSGLLLVKCRLDARESREYGTYEVHLSMHDNARPRDLKDMVEALAASVREWPLDRARHGQPFFALELHYGRGRSGMEFIIALRAEQSLIVALESVFANAYPDVRIGHVAAGAPSPLPGRLREPGYVLRFRKERPFIYPLSVRDEDEEASPTMEAIAQTQVMAGVPSSVRLQFTPAPLGMEGWARRRFREHEDQLARSEQRLVLADAGLRSVLNREEMSDASRAANSALFWFEMQIAAPTGEDANRISAALIARRGENRLQRRRMIIRQDLYRRRFPDAYPPLVPSFGWGNFANLASAAEVAHLLTLPTARMKAVPIRRLTIPRLPPPPEIARTIEGSVCTPDDGAASIGSDSTPWLPPPTGQATNGRPGFEPLPFTPYPVATTDVGPVFLHPDDRKYGTLLIGGQGSGKTSAMLRLALNDIRDPNAAVIVFDPKSELSRVLLNLVPPESGKRVWYLDLGHPAFGMSPLRLPRATDWATEATAIAEGIVSALLDINEGQIFQSSKRYLYHAVIGELAMARLEERRPQFEGVYGLLMPKRDDLREAAANACNHFPDLDQTAEFFRKELPDDLTLSGSAVAQRLDAPRNKISTLVGIPALRRFFNHPSDIPISRIIKARDVLLVDANMAAIGEDNAEACIAFIFRQLHQHMQTQVQWPEDERPRVAVLADEAHYLVSENVVDQIATHRAAGMDVALGLQFFAQLGAQALSTAATEKIRSGVLNLVQSRFMFRLGDPEDAVEATRIAMAVYETMIRADSRVYQRTTPEQLLNLPVYHFIASWIANGSRAASFEGTTAAIPQTASTAWREHHLERMAGVVQPYPEDMGHTYRRQVDPRAFTDLAAEWAARQRNGGSESVDFESRSAASRHGAEPAQSDATTDAAKAGELAPPPPGHDAPHRPAGDEVREPSPGASEQAHSAGLEPDGQLPLLDVPSSAPSRPVRSPHRRRKRPAAGDPDFNVDGSLRVDNFELLPLPDLNRSDVRLLVGREPRGGAQQAHEQAVGRAGGEVPWLLRELAFVDRYRDRGELNRQSGEAVTLSSTDKSLLQVLDRIGLVMRDSLGRAALGEKAKLRTVQHRLKRLYDAGYVARADITIVGATSRLPQIYALTAAGLQAAQSQVPPVVHPDRKYQEPEGRSLTVPHDHHALHWLLQLHDLLGPEVVTDYWRTDRYATGRFQPPQVGAGRNRHTLTLGDIALPDGQMITGLQALDPSQRSGEPRGFREIKPDISIELHVEHARRADGRQGLDFDVLVELDRGKPGRNEDKYIDYDALLTAAWIEHRRFSTLRTRPVVVFVSRSWKSALENAARADTVMTGAVGHSGTPPQTWYYAGRDHIFFTAEEDIYMGSLRALALPQHPPRLRDALGHGANPQPELVWLLPPTMVRRP